MVVLTKADKLSRQQASKQTAAIRKQLNLPKDIEFLATSSESGYNIEELRAIITRAVDEPEE